MSGSFRVLALDDSLTIRKLIELATNGIDIQLQLAEDGKSGVSLAKSFQPDLIFVDYMLPDMKGSDVCAALAADRTTRDIPFYVMSAKGEDILSQFASFPALAGFIHKPFAPADVRNAIEKHGGGVAASVAAMAGSNPSPVTKAPVPAGAPTEDVSFERKQRAAQAIYGALKDAFARIPSWESERGGRSAASYFAQKLLTPARLGTIISALDRSLPASPAPTTSAAPPAKPATTTMSLSRSSYGAEMLLLIGARVPRRGKDFSGKLSRTKLSDEARRVITLVNGTLPISKIAERSGVPAAKIPDAIAELMKKELVAFEEPTGSVTAEIKVDEGMRPVMIVDQDVEGVQRPLAELLRMRGRALDLVNLNAEADLVARVERDRPALLILSDNAAHLDLKSTARQIRDRPATADQRLVALIEPRDDQDSRDRIESLRKAGFDDVVSKPFARGALEHLFS